MVCSIDLSSNRPGAASLRRSILDYVGSDRFAPATSVSPADLRRQWVSQRGRISWIGRHATRAADCPGGRCAAGNRPDPETLTAGIMLLPATLVWRTMLELIRESPMHSIFRALIAVTLLVAASLAFAEEPATPPASQPSADAGTLIQASDKMRSRQTGQGCRGRRRDRQGRVEQHRQSRRSDLQRRRGSKLQTILFVKNREKFDQAFSGDVSKARRAARRCA